MIGNGGICIDSSLYSLFSIEVRKIRSSLIIWFGFICGYEPNFFSLEITCLLDNPISVEEMILKGVGTTSEQTNKQTWRTRSRGSTHNTCAVYFVERICYRPTDQSINKINRPFYRLTDWPTDWPTVTAFYWRALVDLAVRKQVLVLVPIAY